MDAQLWGVAGVVVAALGLFGVMMRALVKEIGNTTTSEIRRVEQKVDLLREAEVQALDGVEKELGRLAARVDDLYDTTRKHIEQHPF